jgi:hypothetical protein
MTDRDAIKEAVREAFQDELKAFYIDREIHYNHHKFLGDWIEWVNQCKSVALKTVVGFFVITVVGLMIAGFMFKVGK